MGDLRKVGAAWRGTTKAGATYYSGKLDAEALASALAGGETRLLIFAVKEKKGKGPDIELFAAPDERTKQAPSRQPARASRVDDINSEPDDEMPWG